MVKIRECSLCFLTPLAAPFAIDSTSRGVVVKVVELLTAARVTTCLAISCKAFALLSIAEDCCCAVCEDGAIWRSSLLPDLEVCQKMVPRWHYNSSSRDLSPLFPLKGNLSGPFSRYQGFSSQAVPHAHVLSDVAP